MQDTTAPPVRNNTSIWSLITGPEASNWSRILVCSHLDEDDRLAVFSTCKAARDMVLVNADHAYVYLGANDEEPSEDEEEEKPRGEEGLNLDRLRAVRAALQTRGKQRTQLGLAYPASMLGFALWVLEAGTTWLDELDIHPSYDGEYLPTAVLASVWRWCPNLRALSVPPAAPPGMPSPIHFPKLEELFVYLGGLNTPVDHVYRSVAPYLEQLTKLTIHSHTPPPPELPRLLLTPGTVATHLRTLKICATLDDVALGLLLQCAPALEELRVTEVRLQSAAPAQAPTRWRQLRTSVLQLSSLARLPLAADNLQIKIDYPGILVCDVIAGNVTAHLKGAQLDCSQVDLRPGIHVADEAAAALRTGLSLVRACPPQYTDPRDPRGFVTLSGWTLSRDVLLELRQLPQDPLDLTFADDLVWLQQPAHLYNTLLRLLPDSVRGVIICRGPGAGGLTNKQVEGICLGAPTTRVQDAPLIIVLRDSAPQLVEALSNKIAQGIYLNVRMHIWG